MLAMAKTIEIEAALAGLGGLRREGGNTHSPSNAKKTLQEPKRKQHFFTINNHTEEFLGGLLTYFNEHSLKYRIQEETGETGTPHLQGCVQFDKEIRSSCWDKQSKGHYEKLKGSWQDCVDYCSKIETRTGRQWDKGLPKPIKLIETLYPWQEEVKNILTSDVYDDRKIYWFWEPNGNVGKSQFAKYMYVKHQTMYLGSGKYADLMNLVFNADMDICQSIIFDIPRSQGNKISYSALESIKVGLITNTKYETGMKVFNPPIIVVFANCEPNLNDDNLSADRWVIKRIE